MEPWRTAIVDAGPDHLRVRGHDVLELMQRSTFTDLVFLLHHDRVPSPGERRVLDAILISVADQGSRVPGFGHRVHSEIDPRVVVLFDLAAREGLAGEGITFARALEQAISTQIKPIPLNIDGALAAILVDMGFPSAVGRLLFIIGRVAAIERVGRICRIIADAADGYQGAITR